MIVTPVEQGETLHDKALSARLNLVEMVYTTVFVRQSRKRERPSNGKLIISAG